VIAPSGESNLSLARIASGQKSLTCAQLLAILQAMRAAIWTVAGLRSALCARRDLLLEIVALRLKGALIRIL
jgi:hypothetical protein